ncbi:type II toxin-antitoxin system HicA family toxin [candidate division KSB1 bacterium]|nr:type II toxin-antitoxin system HicA family toxin [candidate division KSB1 bacterium]
MKLPRDISGEELAKALGKLDYHLTRQTGSHLRLSTQRRGEHHITIPKHRYLKIGTLNNILSEVALHLKLEKEDVIEILFS